MSDNNLVLHPIDPESAIVSVPKLVEVFTGVGLIGQPAGKPDETSFRPGPRFHRLVTFHRSHRVITLINGPEGLVPAAVGDSRLQCTIKIPGPTEVIWFKGVGNVESPCCKCCNYVLEEWPDMVTAWWESKQIYFWRCPKCDAAHRPWELDWHHTNAFARYTVDITGIHYGEAVPSSELLDILGRYTGTPWSYFYYHL
jgi:hypothetical protein